MFIVQKLESSNWVIYKNIYKRMGRIEWYAPLICIRNCSGHEIFLAILNLTAGSKEFMATTIAYANQGGMPFNSSHSFVYVFVYDSIRRLKLLYDELKLPVVSFKTDPTPPNSS